MLAEKLLSKGGYDCDREIRTLELLKLRFGEVNLLNCEARLSPHARATSSDRFRIAPCVSACSLMAETFQVQDFCWQLSKHWTTLTMVEDFLTEDLGGWASKRCCAVQIMLKDMADSKRIDSNIHNIAPQAMSPLRRARRAVRVDDLSATIISSLFWPPHQV